MRLDVEDVSFGYDIARQVLNGASFSYASPGVLCLLGSNGVGKSTLLKCIIGELIPTKGRVLVDGRPVRSYKPRELAHKVAYIAQTHTPTFSYPVLDVVAMGRTARIGYLASPGADDLDIARAQLDYLGISHLAERPYTDISGGERQLVMIASALAQEPEVLLLDEPTAHLDFGNQFKFIELVGRLRQRGMGVVMTTHFPDHALLLDCDTAVLDGGGVCERGPASEVVTPAVLRRIYGVEVSVAEVGRRTVCVPGPLTDPLGDVSQKDGEDDLGDGQSADTLGTGKAMRLPAEYRIEPNRIREVSRGYWLGRAPEYSELHEREAESPRGAAFARLVAGLPYIRPGMRALDLGCGSGFVGIALAQAGCHVTGIDFSEEMLVQARENMAKRGLSYESLRQMDVHDLDFADATFDLIMTRNVTWVLDDVQRVYAEALRVLAPAGHFVNMDADYGHATVARIQAGVTARHPTQSAEQLHVRDTVAANLPVSWVSRPMWDIQSLWNLGASEVTCHRSLNRLLLAQMPEGTDSTAVQAEPGTQGDLFMIDAVK